MIIPSRRRFLAGLTAFLAAPAIVRVAANLMPVSTAALQPNLAWSPLELGDKLLSLYVPVLPGTTELFGAREGTIRVTNYGSETTFVDIGPRAPFGNVGNSVFIDEVGFLT